MNKKIKEAIVIWLILIALISSYFYLKPVITGYSIMAKEFNHTDKISLAISESSSYVWQLADYGELKSIRLNGRIEDKGFAKVYIENKGVRYLIFDSSKLKESLNIITGFSILNQKINETDGILPVNETINGSIINETLPLNQIVNETNQSINKTITINLEYKAGSDYDIDDNGIETTSGVVDLTVRNTIFGWDVEHSKLCTRWQAYSIENEEAVTVCYGNEQCCNFVELGSSSDNWDDVFYSYYGLYGATANNVVSAQVIYVDYNLSLEEPFAEIYYSSWKNLSTKFYYETILFSNVCVESCLLSNFNSSSYKLIFEINNTSLIIDEIKYTTVKEVSIADHSPILIKNISDIFINKNQNYTIDLSSYFFDEDNDLLSYSYYKTDNITVFIDDNIATIVPDPGFVGVRYMFFIANDSLLTTISNIFLIKTFSEPKKFIIKNPSGENIVAVDQDGNMFIKGVKEENQLKLVPTKDSFIIQNKSAVVAYINSSGYLFLKGNLTEKSLMQTEGYNFEIRLVDELIAFFDAQGNLKLRGEMFENYANP